MQCRRNSRKHLLFYDGRQNGPGWISLKHAGFAPEKMGTGPILQERGHSQLEDIPAENGAWPHFFQNRLGFRLRSPLHFGEEPCPLSLQTVFSILTLILSLKMLP